ncbi:hypothetical protein M569_16251, partial [Genlisea aurea]
HIPKAFRKTIKCKTEFDLDGDDSRLPRRRILYFVGASVAADMVARSGWFVQSAEGADLIQRKQRSEFQAKIKQTLAALLKGNTDLIPSLLTLSLNDAITYDK